MNLALIYVSDSTELNGDGFSLSSSVSLTDVKSQKSYEFDLIAFALRCDWNSIIEPWVLFRMSPSFVCGDCYRSANGKEKKAAFAQSAQLRCITSTNCNISITTAQLRLGKLFQLSLWFLFPFCYNQAHRNRLTFFSFLLSVWSHSKRASLRRLLLFSCFIFSVISVLVRARRALNSAIQ